MIPKRAQRKAREKTSLTQEKVAGRRTDGVPAQPRARGAPWGRRLRPSGAQKRRDVMPALFEEPCGLGADQHGPIKLLH